MKTYCLLLALSAIAAAPAAAQTQPAAPSIGLSHRTPGQAAPSYQHPQPRRYQVVSGTTTAPGPASYQTRPHALRVLVPDTTDRRMARLQVPAPAPDDRGVMPLPPQQRVRE